MNNKKDPYSFSITENGSYIFDYELAHVFLLFIEGDDGVELRGAVVVLAIYSLVVAFRPWRTKWQLSL